MKTSPARRLYLLGAILCLALTVCSLNFGDRGGPPFTVALTVAGIAYLFAIREFFATPKVPRGVVVVCLLLAAVWHIEFIRLRPGADDDIHRYVWDGRLQRLGYDPYVVIPSDPLVKGLHSAETRTLNNPDLPSPYPPGAQLFFRAMTAIHESTFTMKLAFVICEFAIVFVLHDLLRLQRQRAHLVLAYAWNPLLAIEVAGSGHIDILGTLLLVLSVAALARHWRAMAALAFGLAVAVKFLPVILLPAYWKRLRSRDAALAAAVVVLLYLPFLNHGHVPAGSLGTYVTGFRFNGPIFAALHQLVPAQWLAGVAVLVGLVTAACLRRSLGESSVEQFAWPMAATLLCAPVVFPWYLLWVLPFLTSFTTLPIIIWTVSITATYVQWHLRAIHGTWGRLPAWVMLIEYGCVAIVAATMILVRNRRQAALNCSTNFIETEE